MIFVIGLGNPGQEYQRTRHNAGFLVLDALAKKFDVEFSSMSKVEGEVAKLGDVVLVKPQTFMNDSGESVRKTLAFYHETKTGAYPNLFVVHDDLDIPLGKWKSVYGSGPKVHNGVNSIRETLESEAFWYIRVGVDNRGGDRQIPGEQYVLQPFPEAEWQTMTGIIREVSDAVYEQIATSSS
jgi:PTH1 family peptidyl-tRNA hydrolase